MRTSSSRRSASAPQFTVHFDRSHLALRGNEAEAALVQGLTIHTVSLLLKRLVKFIRGEIRLPGILPQLSYQEALEVAATYNLMGCEWLIQISQAICDLSELLIIQSAKKL
ncbi:hypothetical protein BCY86_00915 [Pajaroellobacter abortibovis]|uniref:Uncharacterized protein n=1 Tax=Pajaroellobacter abortibovis TaxID=1882918 RepID=A0A1L6MV55_9BACT|nr:hypothetical protein [Pajaroellobacter abortibovis]APR99398.1 hypothetical protein BCY86_00915 [Pajaroellobacter abortibovis]